MFHTFFEFYAIRFASKRALRISAPLSSNSSSRLLYEMFRTGHSQSVGFIVEPMTRNRYVGFIDEHNRGFVVAFTLHWKVIETHRVDPKVGAAQALGAFIARFEERGWETECDASYGFTFMHRGGERILVEATPGDPQDNRDQTFNPFRHK